MRGTPRILEATPTEGWRIWLRFEDGLEAEVDFGYLIEGKPTGVFAPLRDPEYFRQVAIYPGGNAIFWPNEADIAPEALYLRTQEAAGVAA
jgi:Protein of unknown function (DUF2442)